MQATVADLSGWWLEVRCSCGKSGTKLLPFRLLAARHGWDTTLANIVHRLRCNECGARPASLAIVEDASAGAIGSGTFAKGRLVVR